MSRLILTPRDFNQNEIQNALFHNLASDPVSPLEGQFWINTTSHRPKVRLNGSTLDLSDALTLNGQAGSYWAARANHSGTQLASTISDFDTQVRLSRLDQMAVPTGSVSMNSQKITNLANGTVSTDAVNYSQLLAVQNGTRWLDPVVIMVVANVASLSGEQTLDGVLTSTSRVALSGQNTASQNGTYLTGAGAWTRTEDLATGKNAANASFYVERGSYADTQWRCTNNTGSALVGTDGLTFSQFAAGVNYSADETSVHLDGTTFSIKTTWTGQTAITTLGTITTGTWTATAVGVLYGGTGATTAAGARSNLNAVGKYSATIGNGAATSITITQATHGLAADGTNSAHIYDATTGAEVECDITVAPGTGNVTFAFSVAPASNAYRVVICG